MNRTVKICSWIKKQANTKNVRYRAGHWHLPTRTERAEAKHRTSQQNVAGGAGVKQGEVWPGAGAVQTGKGCTAARPRAAGGRIGDG